MKKFLKIVLPVFLCIMLLFLSACSSQGLEGMLGRDKITGITISYMEYIGDDIPTNEISSSDDIAKILDMLYDADAVELDIQQANSYSPELNATHVFYLHTELGSMPVYFSKHQNIFSVPYVVKQGDGEEYRSYHSYQIKADSQATFISQVQGLEPAKNVEDPAQGTQGDAPQNGNGGDAGTAPSGSEPDISAFVPPDDSQLRGAITAEMAMATGEIIPFESKNNPHSGASAIYYAFTDAELSGVEPGKLYIVACPDSASNQSAAISSIQKTADGVFVHITLLDKMDGTMNAAIIDQSIVEQGKPIVFVNDGDQSILYARSIS